MQKMLSQQRSWGKYNTRYNAKCTKICTKCNSVVHINIDFQWGSLKWWTKYYMVLKKGVNSLYLQDGSELKLTIENIRKNMKRMKNTFLTHWGQVTQICVFTLQLCKTDDANLRF